MGEVNKKQPVMIAMKGRPSTAKTNLALSVAKNHSWPLMDHEDLVPALQQCLPPSLLDEEDFINDFSFEAICRIAQSQLRLNPSVLITSPLYNKNHFDRLVDMAASNHFTLILIDCRSPQEELPPSNYDFGDVTNFILDLTGEEIDDLKKFIESYSNLALDSNSYPDSMDSDYEEEEATHEEEEATHEGEEETDKEEEATHEGEEETDKEEEATHEEEEESDEEDGDQKLLKDLAHPNHLVFCEDEERNNDDGISCKACLEPISGQIYSCVECELFLHKSCAELPQMTNSPVFSISPPEPLYLSLRSSAICWACGDPRKKCVYQSNPTISRRKTYNLELDPECAKSPSELVLDFHPDHMLYLSIDRSLYGYGPKCNACRSECWPIRYSCSKCDVHLHVRCAQLPILIKHKCHCDPLTLTQPSSHALDEEFYCDVCETRREADHWFYYCSDCDFAAHLSCVIPDMNPHRDDFNISRDKMILKQRRLSLNMNAVKSSPGASRLLSPPPSPPPPPPPVYLPPSPPSCSFTLFS